MPTRLAVIFSAFLLALPTHVLSEVMVVDADRLQRLIEQGAQVIDVRTPEEWQATGVIPSSERLMLFDQNGQVDEKKWLDQFRQTAGSGAKPVVFVCRSGFRSRKAAELVDSKFDRKTVYTLKGGIMNWMEQGKPVEK